MTPPSSARSAPDMNVRPRHAITRARTSGWRVARCTASSRPARTAASMALTGGRSTSARAIPSWSSKSTLIGVAHAVPAARSAELLEFFQRTQQRGEFGWLEELLEALLVLRDPRLDLAQGALARGREVQLLAPTVDGGPLAQQKASFLEPIGDRHHGGAIHAQRLCDRHLRHTRVRVDEPKSGGLFLRQLEARNRRGHVVAVHGALRPAQTVAQPTVELLPHEGV